MNIKYLLLALLLSLPSIVSAKYDPATRNRLMQKASQEYQSGKYDTARKIYFDIYVEDGDKESQNLLEKCKQCITLLADATMAERNAQFTIAIEKYQALMELNPCDPMIPMLLTECNIRLYTPIRQQAKDFYREGKYAEAKKKLLEYPIQSDEIVIELSNSINRCIDLVEKATQAVQREEYKQAVQYYNNILEINPTDIISTKAIAQIEAQNKRMVTATAEATLTVTTKVDRNSYCR